MEVFVVMFADRGGHWEPESVEVFTTLEDAVAFGERMTALASQSRWAEGWAAFTVSQREVDGG